MIYSSFPFMDGGENAKFLPIETTHLSDSLKVEIFEMQTVEGLVDLASAQQWYFANQQGMRPRFVKITIIQGSFVIEPRLVVYRAGNITTKLNTAGPGKQGVTQTLLNMAKSSLTQEKVVRTEYTGTGEIWLAPTFDHFITLRITPAHGNVICDSNMFLACETSVSLSVEVNPALASVGGGEQYFQTKLFGDGMVIFRSPIPRTEIMCYTLQSDALEVNGKSVLLRAGELNLTLSFGTNNLLHAFATGEGLLQRLEGTGMVYLAATAGIYEHLKGVVV